MPEGSSSDPAGGGTTGGSDGDIDLVICCVTNSCTYPSPPEKFNLDIPRNTTLVELKKKLEEKLGYKNDCFDVSLNNKKTTNEQNDQTLLELNIKGKKALVMLSKKKDADPSDFGDEKRVTVSAKPSYATPTDIYTNRFQNSPAGSDIGVFTSRSGESNATSSTSTSSSSGHARNAAARSASDDSSSSSSSSYSSSSADSKSKSGYVGLSNQGATCYMNSLIQTLYMSPEFRNALYKWNFDENYLKWKNENREEIEKQDSLLPHLSAEEKELKRKSERERVSIPRQLQLLFARLQLSDVKSVKTKDLTNSFGWKDSDAFTQHDVQELCRVLFDALEKVLKGTEQEHLINDLYQGEMKDYVRCSECKTESHRMDKFLDIPLVIRGFGSSKPIKSVEEALEKFVQPEILNGDNQYSCEKCKKKVDAKKGLKLQSLPTLLTLQLKRFDFDYNLSRRIKLNDRVTFPTTLDMSKFVEKSKKGKSKSDKKTNENSSNEYELYSILIHRGSALGGHYYAYIKSLETGKWFEFNDSNVSEISESDIQKTYGEDVQPKSGLQSYFQSSANAYMLMYRKKDKLNNQKFFTDKEVPEELRNYLKNENEERIKKRDTVEFKVYYQGKHIVMKLHNTTTLDGALVKSAEALGVTHAREHMRFRNYNEYKERPGEPIDKPDILKRPLKDFNITPNKALLIETKHPSELFPQFNSDDVALKIIRFDKDENKFSEPTFINVDQEAKLIDLKRVLQEKFKNIPIENQRIIRESYATKGPPGKILEGDDKSLKTDHRVTPDTVLYLEYCTDSKSESLVFAELERLRDLIEVKYNLIGSADFNQSISISRKSTIKQLKEAIQQKIGLPADEFKLSRTSFSMKSGEIRNEEESLEENRFSDETKLLVEKGKPLKEGENKLKIYLFDPENKRLPKDNWEEMFEIIIHDDELISDFKVRVCEKLKEVKNFDIDPKFLRVREMYTKNPSTIFNADLSFKKNSTTYSNGKQLAIQELSEKEKTKSDDECYVFIKQWFPSKWETSAKGEEILVKEKISAEVFRKLISEKKGIKNVAFVKVYSNWPGANVMDIPDMDWYPDDKSKNGGKSMLSLKDGDLIYIKDQKEVLKELTPEEKKKMEKETSIKKKSYFNHREEALTINTNA